MASESRVQPDGLVSYVAVILRSFRWIALLVGGALIVTFGFTKLMPKVYESTATLIAPKEAVGGALLGGLGNLTSSGMLQQISGLSLPSLSPNRDLLVSVLKSRTVAEAVVTEFKLRERYRATYLEDAIKKLEGRTTIAVSKEGLISVRVEDTDPELAARIANYYVEQLDRLVLRYGSSEA